MKWDQTCLHPLDDPLKWVRFVEITQIQNASQESIQKLIGILDRYLVYWGSIRHETLNKLELKKQ